MVAVTQPKRCIWCGKSESSLTKDHVFPRSLGGTKELWVEACEECQTATSKAEQEVARRSEFALYRLMNGPLPRTRAKPSSGALETQYALVANWLSKYAEVAIRVNRDPVPLPCIEVDLATLRVRCHGEAPEAVDKLVEAIERVVTGPSDESGLLGELPVHLFDEVEADIASDPEFWPRAFLDLDERLKVRARDGNEAELLMGLLVELAKRGAFKNHYGWVRGEVPSGTSHRIRLEWSEEAVWRVVAKMAYSVAHLWGLPKKLDSEWLRQVRDFVRGSKTAEVPSLVRALKQVGSITEWPDHHVVLIRSNRHQLRGLVVLYGACFLVDLGKNPLPVVFAKAVAAMSRLDGTQTRFVNEDIAETIAKTLRRELRKASLRNKKGGRLRLAPCMRRRTRRPSGSTPPDP